MSGVVSWWVFAVRYEVREVWRALPGPWWCKALLLAACLVALPGPFDELILAAVVSVLRKRRARKQAGVNTGVNAGHIPLTG